ncbi:hypothetical protein UPYG_G00189380 [Umbra pygmaea]|uniref:MABP domain-containing protein n=1 Tax=Umbra pygmaea TaxID=75934 RepID=A0ABD0XF91_UMBPY
MSRIFQLFFVLLYMTSCVKGTYTTFCSIMSKMEYITDIAVSTDANQKQGLSNQHFKMINVDLNKGTKGNPVYLWYKKGTTKPITRLQAAFTDEMKSGLTKAGYHHVNGNVNEGNKGDEIYFWYYKGITEYDNPIMDLKVTTSENEEAEYFKMGYEHLACDLNRSARGKYIYLWVKKEKKMFISDITVSTAYGLDERLFNQGYTRVDEDLNRGSDRNASFIWYRRSQSQSGAINDLVLSTNNQTEVDFQLQDYTKVGVNLEEGTKSQPIFVWYKKGSDNPIMSLTVIREISITAFLKPGIVVIKTKLNKGNDQIPLYLAFPNVV